MHEISLPLKFGKLTWFCRKILKRSDSQQHSMADSGKSSTNTTTNTSCNTGSTSPTTLPVNGNNMSPEKEVEENGHASSSEDPPIKNGLGSEVSSLASSPSTPPQSALPQQPARVNSPGRLSRSRGNQRASPSSLNYNSGGGGGGGGDSPITSGGPGLQNPSSASSSGSQHVVHVHVNPGETFSVRLGDQIQHIQGKSFRNFFIDHSVIAWNQLFQNFCCWHFCLLLLAFFFK